MWSGLEAHLCNYVYLTITITNYYYYYYQRDVGWGTKKQRGMGSHEKNEKLHKLPANPRRYWVCTCAFNMKKNLHKKSAKAICDAVLAVQMDWCPFNN